MLVVLRWPWGPGCAVTQSLPREGMLFECAARGRGTILCPRASSCSAGVSVLQAKGIKKWCGLQTCHGVHVYICSAFSTGIYGMKNLYVFALMSLYVSPHKNCGDDRSNSDLWVHSGEEPQLTSIMTHVDGPTKFYKLSFNEAQE